MARIRSTVRRKPPPRAAAEVVALRALAERIERGESKVHPAFVTLLEDILDAEEGYRARVEQAGDPGITLAELSARLGLDD